MPYAGKRSVPTISLAIAMMVGTSLRSLAHPTIR